MIGFQRAIAYVDWNNQIHGLRATKRRNGSHALSILAEQTEALRFLGKSLSTALHGTFPSLRFLVEFRFYYGWLKGLEPTIGRKAFIQAATIGLDTLTRHPTFVQFRPEYGRGDTLILALEKRLNAGAGCHLPNTLRTNYDRPSGIEEKMVDTALVSDLIANSFESPNDWHIAVGDDDDLIPGILTAEAAIQRGLGRVLVLRTRGDGSMLNLEGLRL